MKSLNIRFPDELHEKLKQYKNETKPHMSINSIIVEAVLDNIKKEKESKND